MNDNEHVTSRIRSIKNIDTLQGSTDLILTIIKNKGGDVVTCKTLFLISNILIITGWDTLTRRLSPGDSLLVMKMVDQTVHATSGKLAASVKETPFGTGRTCSAGVATFSAYPPPPRRAHTYSYDNSTCYQLQYCNLMIPPNFSRSQTLGIKSLNFSQKKIADQGHSQD